MGINKKKSAERGNLFMYAHFMTLIVSIFTMLFLRVRHVWTGEILPLRFEYTMYIILFLSAVTYVVYIFTGWGEATLDCFTTGTLPVTIYLNVVTTYMYPWMRWMGVLYVAVPVVYVIVFYIVSRKRVYYDVKNVIREAIWRSFRMWSILSIMLVVICIMICGKKKDEIGTAVEDKTLAVVSHENAITDVDNKSSNDRKCLEVKTDILNLHESDKPVVDKINGYYGCVYVPDTELSFKEYEKVFLTAEEKPILTCKYLCPQITHSSNEAVAEVINAYFQNDMLEWFNERESEAAENESSFIQSGEEWSCHWENISTRTVKCGRADQLVVSFCVEDYVYYGGAHGFLSFSTISFDKNGEILGFEDICYDREQVLVSIKEYIIARPYHSDTVPDALEKTIDDQIAVGNYYFAHEGMVIVFPQYELAGVADGCVRLVIPYDEIHGLAADYDYFGNVSRCLRAECGYVEGMTASVDLDGDGKDDIVNVEKVFMDTAPFDGSYRITINGIDHSDDVSMYPISHFVDYNWYIEDIDSSDAYIEMILRLDESALVLRYIDDKLIVLGEIEGTPSIDDHGFQVNGDGIFKCNYTSYCIQNGALVLYDETDE